MPESQNPQSPETPKDPRAKKVVSGIYDLSLGLSVVVAILLGALLGYGLMKFFHQTWLLWLGLFFGIAAAIKNIHLAYKRAQRELEQLAKDPKYQAPPAKSKE